VSFTNLVPFIAYYLLVIVCWEEKDMYPKFSRAGQNVARVPEEEQKDRLRSIL